MERKAAFQMSLGFIIAVVFAIVLLSLALTWLRGLIENVVGITDDLSQDAREQLRITFSETAAHFGVWPPSHDLDPGGQLKTLASIKNDAPDGQPHLYVINMIAATASPNVVNSYGCSSFDTCTELETKMLSWLTFDTDPLKININEIDDFNVFIQPDADTVSGTYLFRLVACSDHPPSAQAGSPPVSSACTPTTQDWGSSEILITI